MPSYKGRRSIDYGDNLKSCGFYIEFTHLSSGTKARFVGEVTDFKDAYTSKWEEKPVYGRMDPISTFQRTGRKISISWKIINEDALTGEANMLEIQKLIHFLYPDYYSEENNASTISGGPVLRLKFANLSNTRKSGPGLVGYLDGFTFDPDFNSSFVQAKEDSIISTVINASINFTVLHTTKLGWTKKRRRARAFPYGHTDEQLEETEAAYDVAFKTAREAALDKKIEQVDSSTLSQGEEASAPDGLDPDARRWAANHPNLVTMKKVVQGLISGDLGPDSPSALGRSAAGDVIARVKATTEFNLKMGDPVDEVFLWLYKKNLKPDRSSE